MQNRVALVPGRAYHFAEHGWYRITFAFGQEVLEEGLTRIARALEEKEDGADVSAKRSARTLDEELEQPGEESRVKRVFQGLEEGGVEGYSKG